MKIKYIITIFVLIFIITTLLNITENYDEIDNNNSNKTLITFNLISGGFYSEFFFALNNYIYCKRNKINFKLNTDNWVFKTKYGWTDYFENIDLKFYNDDEVTNNLTKKHGDYDKSNVYKLIDYKNEIPNFYVYNETVKTEIKNTKYNLNLKTNDYDAIFIRRGDKLVGESKYINEKEYLDLLLEINPYCQKIFLQTDDYNCYLNLQKLLLDKELYIELITICDKNMFGSFNTKKYKDEISNNQYRQDNGSYLENNKELISKQKPIHEMNNEEIYKHVMDMLIGIDIVLNSKYCVTDYQSNVSRFIKLAHNNSNNVTNVLDRYNDIDYEITTCPAWPFEQI